MTTAESLFANGGEMGRIMRDTDWSKTVLGEPERWSPALRMMTKFLLANRFPQLLWWGPQFCSIYNDAYSPILGTKHPWALGQPVSEVWKEIWHVLKPLIETPFYGGPATWMEDIPLELNRRGFLEETHFTIAYSPVPDETAPKGIGGVLATVHEITAKVVGERRVHALRDLGAQSAEPKSAEQACSIVGETLSKYPKDIPFLLLYLLGEKQQSARLACSVAADPNDLACPAFIDLSSEANEPWPLSKVRTTAQIQLVTKLENKFERVPQGPWEDPPSAAAVLPLRSSLQGQLAGFMIGGLSSRIEFDDNYRDFLNLISSQVATMIANARAYDEERKRAEALAELDKAKTLFFSNVSHELRTPLTLLLGPTESALSSKDGALKGTELEMVHRNELRLLKLVNTLLDFSRIEAGRVQAIYEPIDLGRVTADIASAFRSVMEHAGLRFSVDCEPINEETYLDRQMWEKIVLNLLSNAFKFTFEGGVHLSLKSNGNSVELVVRDSGIGIPETELTRVFERFHRIENVRARTYEGTGIGLALVQELVKLHGGSVSVESASGEGSTFKVVIPTGSKHLPAERIQAARTQSSTALSAEAYVEEAARWLPKKSAKNSEVASLVSRESSESCPEKRDVIVVADDNADMREYVAQLLEDRYTVCSVSDGVEAIKATRLLRPALVLTDVMMPGLDGFGVLREIRNDESLRSTPVILLSARAGEESRLEGLDAGADDYLVKPFTAGELIARIGTHVKMGNLRRGAMEREARLRSAAELEKRRLQELLALAPAAIGLMFGPEHRWEFVNDQYVRVTGRGSPSDFIGKTLRESLPEIETQPFIQLLDEVYRTGKPYFGNEMKAVLNRGAGGQPEETYFDFVYQPLRNAGGQTEGILVHAVEVTAKVLARKATEEAAERLRLAYSAAQIGAWEWDPVNNTRRLSDELHEMFAIDKNDRDSDRTWASRVHPDDLQTVLEKMEEAHRLGEMEFEYRYRPHEGELRWFYCKGRRFSGETRMFGIVQDVTERKRAAEALQESEKKYRDLAESATIALHWVGSDGTILWANQAELDMLGYTAEEYIGRNITEFHVDSPVIDDILDRLCRGERLHEYEARLRAKDGSIRHVVISSSVLFENEKFIHTRCFTRDVTERKYTEEALAESEERYRTVAETASDAILSIDENSTILFANSATAQVFGYRPAEIIGKSLTMLMPAKMRHMHEAGVQHYVSTGKRHLNWDATGLPGLHKDGHEIPLEVSFGEYTKGGKHYFTGFARDISQRKLAEQALRESEQRLRVVTDATPVMIWMSGTDKLCYYFNKSWLDFVGRTLEQEMGNGWAENVHPDDFDRCLQIYVASFDSRRPFEMHYRLRHHTGQYRWILDHGVPRFTSDGTFEGYVGGCLDIHEQKEADEKVRVASEALRESEERLRALVTSTSYVLYRMSPDWSEMRQLDGRGFISDTQEPTKNWIDVYIHPDDQPLVLRTIKHAIETKSVFELEHRVRRVDGTLGWTLSRAVPLLDKDGNIVEWFGAATDVTARKNAEEARRRLAAIVESSGDAIISKDLNSIVTSWNRQAERLFGYKEEEMIGRSVLTIIPPELHGDEDTILSKIRGGQKIHAFETVRVAKSGERIDVSISISPVRDERGNVVGAAKIARDIREYKKIERALRTTEKLAAAGRLAATVAHEINNPLEAVANLVYLAKRDLPDTEKVASYLSSAKQELNRVAHITRQTLGFYRDTSSPIRFKVASTIDDLLGLYERRFETRSIRLIKQYDNDADIVALAGEIRQAFSNLLTNALDAMPSGGTLSLRVHKAHEWNNAHVLGVRITIADSGSGISPQHKHSLFQPFFTTKADVGTGLGLWITRGIIEKHGGFIRVKSRVGENHGTTFSIFLPCEAKNSQQQSQSGTVVENELVPGD
ncbi:MAG TPA: PAS domain S-box protein [Terriglobales bacterium]|nr:PAS domain S-box protein [Terriglobales bacterium]